jgi:hypothetical protein
MVISNGAGINNGATVEAREHKTVWDNTTTLTARRRHTEGALTS